MSAFVFLTRQYILHKCRLSASIVCSYRVSVGRSVTTPWLFSRSWLLQKILLSWLFLSQILAFLLWELMHFYRILSVHIYFVFKYTNLFVNLVTCRPNRIYYFSQQFKNAVANIYNFVRWRISLNEIKDLT